MFGCFLCELTCEKVNLLILHMKLQHTLTIDSKYICKQKDCISEFQNVHAFKKHLTKKHSNEVQNSHQPEYVSDIELPMIRAVSDSGPELEPSDIEVSISPLKMRNFVESSAASFISKLYSRSSMPRSEVQNIISFDQELLGSVLGILKEQVMIAMDSDTTCEKKSEIRSLFDICEHSFDSLDTEYKRFKYFKNSGFYIEPVSYIIGQTTISKTVDGIFKLIPTNVTGQFIPIKNVLQKFLGMPNTLDIILCYMKDLENRKTSGVISNIVQGELWQEIKDKYKDKIVLPLVIYFDEYETNNPLGSHTGTHKLGAVYFYLPGIPPQFRSILKNIFLTLLFQDSDRKEFGNKATFQPLIDHLKDLELEGLLTSNGTQIHISCILVTGDNLGVHQVCGLVESFAANYPCRICKVSKEDLRKQTVEHVDLVRKFDEYESELRKNDVAVTGLSEYCIWNDLPSYHLFKNLFCDITHDMCEGVVRYEMSDLILHYINIKLFTLDDLNNRIGGFDFGPLDSGNRPPFLSKEKLNRKTLGFSASEALTFVQHFGLIIGDLIPPDDEFWTLYVYLKKIMDILTMRSIDNQCIIYLRNLIEEHHQTYIRLFGETLKPKHHFMLHYSRIITLIGPLINVCCIRCEAKHQPFKVAARVSYSRINLPYSLAVKHQLQLCERFWSKDGLSSAIEYSNAILTDIESLSCSADLVNLLPHDFRDKLYSVSFVKIDNITYKPFMILAIGIENDLPRFVVISHILMNDDKSCVFITNVMNTIELCVHVGAYKVTTSEAWLCVPYKTLYDKFPTYAQYAADGNKFVLYNKQL